ncbi:hypothetical protein MKW98_020255 [Papaver atlanticum]|uniref:DUF3444 domain-containing protein n=1 Tax=Papaver atlanticum TaxID=357466 RepID=A0AAD4TE01_9MAGN|nr:hypothetical protein MKW98_020255 [Papaver atlanticum]
MWAIFDNLDGMHRYYARINKVYSPFKVDLTWLEFVPGDLDETAWKRSGLPVACGKFKHEKTDTIEDIDTFSHKIVREKAVRNTYKIYPRKGETWALCKNWNMKWSSEPNNHREVPSFRTIGRERKDVPEGYFELDPASLPCNLEEVSDFVDVKAETVEDGVTSKEERVSEQIPSSPSSSIDLCAIPKSVFYSFKDDKTEDKFQAGQVWALYCELDGLPKYYGLIKKVESTPEFKVNIQWLEACNPPKGVLRCLDSKMPRCCGVFSGGDKTEFDDTASFSHLSKGAAALKNKKYDIYPFKDTGTLVQNGLRLTSKHASLTSELLVDVLQEQFSTFIFFIRGMGRRETISSIRMRVPIPTKEEQIWRVIDWGNFASALICLLDNMERLGQSKSESGSFSCFRSLVSCTFPVLGSQGTGIFQLKSVRPGDDALLPVLFQFLQPSTLAAGRSLRRQERDTKNKSFINKIHKPVLQH